MVCHSSLLSLPSQNESGYELHSTTGRSAIWWMAIRLGRITMRLYPFRCGVRRLIVGYGYVADHDPQTLCWIVMDNVHEL